MDHGKLTGVVFLDMKKAFDMVNYNILVKKLHRFNIEPTSVDWLSNYLEGRFQSVKCQEPIERVSSTKYLGVILDEHLTFEEHITYIHQKASKKTGILYKSKDYLDRSTKILLYKSLILPHIDYCLHEYY